MCPHLKLEKRKKSPETLSLLICKKEDGSKRKKTLDLSAVDPAEEPLLYSIWPARLGKIRSTGSCLVCSNHMLAARSVQAHNVVYTLSPTSRTKRRLMYRMKKSSTLTKHHPAHPYFEVIIVTNSS